MSEVERELGWDDQIENDGPDFEILPEGDYDFEVVGFERGRHTGSDKLPACNKAIVSIRISGTAGISTIKHQLFLHAKTEGLLCAFFTGIGQRKHGERLTMNWNKVVGSKGRCKVYIDKWISNTTGKELTSNKISKFYDPPDTKPAANFQPGRF